jgi:hypothetical protein
VNEQEVGEAVSAWVQATCPGIETGYAYPVSSKLGALPDVVAFVTGKRLGPDHPEFPFAQLDQSWMRVFTLEVSIMVQADGDGEAAHGQLQEFGELLEQAIVEDATLGGRVEMASPQIQFDYSTPFVEYQDGTRGRELFINMTVAELAPQPE